MRITNTDIGRAGEFLVMSRLQARGYYCVHSDSYSDDIWMKLDDGSIRTIQVKTATASKKRSKNSAPKYQFLYAKNTIADFYALVALDVERVLFLTKQQFHQKTISINSDKFKEQAEHDSLLFCLDQTSDVGSRHPNVSKLSIRHPV
jgi:hypothetical protein